VPEIPNAAIGKATINTNVSLRRGPDTTYGHIQTLNNGWKVEVMGEATNGWTPIRYNAAKGWVPSSTLTAGWGWAIVDQMITPVRSIPMMSGPNSGTRVVQVPPGTLVDITGAAQGTWAPARWAGYSGWMDTALMYQPENYPAPAPVSDRDRQMTEIIYAAADKWGQSRVDMIRVARCESFLDPNIVNPASGTSGLFQFRPSTFAFTPNGKAGEDIFNPVSNADAAGWMWANGMRHHWACQ
jgi:SH3-like domain-containing protein